MKLKVENIINPKEFYQFNIEQLIDRVKRDHSNQLAEHFFNELSINQQKIDFAGSNQLRLTSVCVLLSEKKYESIVDKMRVARDYHMAVQRVRACSSTGNRITKAK